MQKKVEEYLKKVEQMETQKLQQEEKEKAEKEANNRNSVLRAAKLLEREYSNKTEFSPEYPLLDQENKTYYRIVPLKVSEEEWEAIKTAYEKEKKITKQPTGTVPQTNEYVDNAVAKALKVIAIIIFVCGAISGAIIGISAETFMATLAIWFSVFVVGTMMLGFSEIVKLLDNINDKMDDI